MQLTLDAAQHKKSTPRHRILAGVLSLVYVALMAFVFYLGITGAEQRWYFWGLIVTLLLSFAILAVLPFLIVKLFFGLSFMQGRRFQFSLRGMLLIMPVICVLIWLLTQLEWHEERQRWRRNNRAAVRSPQGQLPPGLVWLFDSGESRIEIKNGTQEQIAEAKRLFPEATVVATGGVPDGTQAVPAAAPVEPLPAAGK